MFITEQSLHRSKLRSALHALRVPLPLTREAYGVYRNRALNNNLIDTKPKRLPDIDQAAVILRKKYLFYQSEPFTHPIRRYKLRSGVTAHRIRFKPNLLRDKT